MTTEGQTHPEMQMKGGFPFLYQLNKLKLHLPTWNPVGNLEIKKRVLLLWDGPKRSKSEKRPDRILRQLPRTEMRGKGGVYRFICLRRRSRERN
jgi:hypothetical protein